MCKDVQKKPQNDQENTFSFREYGLPSPEFHEYWDS